MPTRNVNLTEQLDRFVRQKVSSGRYENASEVVRAALRRMEDEEIRETRLAQPATEDIVADLTEEQRSSVRRRVLAAIAEIDRGEFTTFEGPEGLRQLADTVKARGRARIAKAK